MYFPLPFSGGPSFIIERQSKSVVPLDGENLDTQTNEDSEENHKPTNHPQPSNHATMDFYILKKSMFFSSMCLIPS